MVFEDPRADIQETLTHPQTGVAGGGIGIPAREWTAIDASIAADLQKLDGIGPGTASVTSRSFDDRT